MKLTLRMWILIIALIAALLMIVPFQTLFEKGVIIKSVVKNSTSFNEGLKQGMIIQEINGQKIESPADYSRILTETFEQGNSSKINIKTKQGDFVFVANSLNISVGDIPKTRIKTGLDLSGGARAIVKAANKSLTVGELEDLIAITSQRLNAFGITDVNIRAVNDLGGNNYMLVELAGATPSDLRELVGQQGKFEAKVGNITVFKGGEEDISDVCRNDAKCSGIRSCDQVEQGGFSCNFNFVIYLTEEAAKKHAEITGNIGLDSSGQYLADKLYLYLDDQEVDSLYISADLKGQVATQILISGYGSGATQKEAFDDASTNMKKLQTVLITGSLPYKLEIVKLDTISPFLGEQFTKSLMLLALFVFIAVSITILFKYRKIKLTLAVILTMFSEVFLTLGIAALIRWNLDAPSIAGIIAGIGTGVNDQIVLLDESTEVGETRSTLKERIKRALFIIIGAYTVIVAAMLPLFWAGAGMLRGFALTTILGVSVGILITRPAFADIIRRIQE